MKFILVVMNSKISFGIKFFIHFSILPYDAKSNDVAITTQRKLKVENKKIDIPDLMIAARAISNNLKLATLNKKHFSRIDELELLS
jgi:predicted nucleic acid-binding protein